MEVEPFLDSPTQSQQQLEAIPEEHDHHFSFPIQQSLSTHHINEIQDYPQQQMPQSSTVDLENRTKKPGSFHRCKTAPAMAVFHDPKHKTPKVHKPQSESSSIIRQAVFLLLIYLFLGVSIYSFNKDNFSGVESHPVVDALYFCIVTMCTIGYGDIAPLTPATKAFACIFVWVGFGFIDILLSGLVNYALDLQENLILTSIKMGKAGGFSARNYIVDVAKGRMRIRLKVGLALGVVVFCIGLGALILFFVEGLDLLDSVYLSVMSVATVGYRHLRPCVGGYLQEFRVRGMHNSIQIVKLN